MKWLVVLTFLWGCCVTTNSLATDTPAILSELKQLRKSLDRIIDQVEADVAKPDMPRKVERRPRSIARCYREREMASSVLRAELGGGKNIVADPKVPKTSEVCTTGMAHSRIPCGCERARAFMSAPDLAAVRAWQLQQKRPAHRKLFESSGRTQNETRLHLRTREGFYIHAMKGGGGGVDARVRTPKTSQVFTLIAAGKPEHNRQ